MTFGLLEFKNRPIQERVVAFTPDKEPKFRERHINRSMVFQWLSDVTGVPLPAVTLVGSLFASYVRGLNVRLTFDESSINSPTKAPRFHSQICLLGKVGF